MEEQSGPVSRELRQTWPTPRIAIQHMRDDSWEIVTHAAKYVLGEDLSIQHWTEAWPEILSEAIEAADTLHQ